jgi:hypothetical protein
MTVVAIAAVMALAVIFVPIGVLAALPTLVVALITVLVAIIVVFLGNDECASRLRIQRNGPLTLSRLRAVQGCQGSVLETCEGNAERESESEDEPAAKPSQSLG